MKYVVEQNTLKLEPVFDGERPIGSTRDMRTWYTTRIAEPTQRCQVSHIVVDSGWEKYAANVVEAHHKVAAWVKNDHLGFHILYLWNGSKRKFIPDFLVRYTSRARRWCWRSRVKIHRPGPALAKRARGLWRLATQPAQWVESHSFNAAWAWVWHEWKSGLAWPALRCREIVARLAERGTIVEIALGGKSTDVRVMVGLNQDCQKLVLVRQREP
jgi:hypothetical protein